MASNSTQRFLESGSIFVMTSILTFGAHAIFEESS